MWGVLFGLLAWLRQLIVGRSRVITREIRSVPLANGSWLVAEERRTADGHVELAAIGVAWTGVTQVYLPGIGLVEFSVERKQMPRVSTLWYVIGWTEQMGDVILSQHASQTAARRHAAMFRESDIAYDEILVQRNQELDFSARYGENQ